VNEQVDYARGRTAMKLSARNQLPGVVKSVRLGNVMAEVVVDVAGNEVVAAITRVSAENLNLQQGKQVTVIIKSTEVMLATD
jgi:molybdopterin-binding protein